MKVLLKGLSVPIGPAVSLDRTFVLFSEYKTKRIKKYWLTGLKANTAEIILDLPGNPSKVKRASTPGEFWVAVTVYNRLPTGQVITPHGFRINSAGVTLQQKDFQGQYTNLPVSVVQEYNGRSLYIGSRGVTFVGIYSINY